MSRLVRSSRLPKDASERATVKSQKPGFFKKPVFFWYSNGFRFPDRHPLSSTRQSWPAQHLLKRLSKLPVTEPQTKSLVETFVEIYLSSAPVPLLCEICDLFLGRL